MNFDVRAIPFPACRAFVEEHHYARGMHNGPTACFGLFSGARLMGVCAFATPISENVRASVFGPEERGRVTELHRLCLLDEAPHSSESYFVARCLEAVKDARPDLWAIVSFADTGAGHVGTVYQASNAFYTGHSRPESYYIDPATGRRRAGRQCGRNVRPEEAKERGWILRRGGVKHRYLFLAPDDRRHARRLRESLRLPQVTPYPKLGYTNGSVPQLALPLYGGTPPTP